MYRHRLAVPMLALCASMTGCSSSGPGGDPAPTSLINPPATTAPTIDAATRTSPVIAGRPARVFVMAGVGKNCEALPAPTITVTAAPAKGEVTFRPGQETVIAASAQGTCANQKAIGTGIYYTARAGSTGTDMFSVSAELASGEVTTRTFEVKIEE